MRPVFLYLAKRETRPKIKRQITPNTSTAFPTKTDAMKRECQIIGTILILRTPKFESRLNSVSAT
jgi:hypothetical protein